MPNDPLINRTEEVARLTQLWSVARAGKPQLAVVWGRRRSGKTFLLSHYTQDKRCIFFPATRQAEGVELRRFGETIRRHLGDRIGDLAAAGFSDWEKALRFVASLAENEPLIVVMDEVPYLARSSPGFASIVQSVWDHLRTGTKLLLVLTGSAIGTMREMLGPGGALRGRPALQMRLELLDPAQARLFLPRLVPTAFCEAYAACGGYPLHLRSWDQGQSTLRNLRRLAFTPGGLLLEDAGGILAEELPEKGGYQRILSAIGRGRTRHSEISGEAEQRIDHPLEVLVRSGFVSKEAPIGAPKGVRPTYRLSDPYLTFWFRVLYSERSLIEGGQGLAVEKRTAPRWQGHLGHTFESMARAHAGRLVASGVWPSDMIVGRWWSQKGKDCEIDVLGLRSKRTALVGEVRWQTSPLGGRELAQLRAKLSHAPRPVEEPILALWGRSGGTEAARRAGATLFGADDVVDGLA